MIRKSDVIQTLTSLTERLSDQVRTVALGVLALAWGLLVGKPETVGPVSPVLRAHLVIIGGLAIVVMFFDFLQYVAGYRDTRKLLNAMEKKGLEESQYDPASWWRKLRFFFFYAKQWVLAFVVIWLLFVLVRWLA